MCPPWERRSTVVLAILLWKFLLLVFTWQPVPANDSFFYDGGVVNLLLHGQYVNPSLAINYPISGRELFSAYPPLSQGVLLAWMSVFGTSELAAMALHWVLFAAYALCLLGIMLRLNLPAGAVHLGGLFLLAITFHDRPDSTAHALGMFAVYAWVRAAFPGPERRSPDPRVAGWHAAMTAGVVLSLAASLQIGAAYAFLIWCGILLAHRSRGVPVPWVAMGLMVGLPLVMIGVLAVFFPLFCQGFMESAARTAFFTGLRLPGVMDLLKVVRGVPGVLLCAGLLLWPLWLLRRSGPAGGGRDTGRHHSARADGDFRAADRVGGLTDRQVCAPSAAPPGTSRLPGDGAGIMGLAALLTAVPIVLASLTVVSPNTVLIALYLQPLVVACVAAWSGRWVGGRFWPRAVTAALLGAALLCSIRAIGMSTWGVACARDVSARKALKRVDEVLAGAPEGESVVLSAAYLYRAARHTHVRWVHSDHPGPFDTGEPLPELDALLTLRPASLVLTQFDYYRRYEPAIRALEKRPKEVTLRVRQTSGVRTPDSMPAMQRVVQHLAWAPVIVEFEWKHGREKGP